MLYRRFGRTEIQMPVLSCGGMRYMQSWKAGDAISDEAQANLEATVHSALDHGIRHIETARGYGTSEAQLGRILPRLPRDELVVQSKVSPTADPQEFAANFDDSMDRLGLEYLDLFALHGINDRKTLDWALREGGCLDHAFQLRDQGRVRHLGFSTHGPTEVILDAVRSNRFDYVNLHYYYFFQDNRRAVEEAARRDMGVFIISPTNKGGKLESPPPKLAELTAPLSPMEFNDLWCWSHPEVHTLSVGAARPSDFDAHVAAVQRIERGDDPQALTAPIAARLQEEFERVLGRNWAHRWREGLPHWQEMPGRMNVREILRLRNLSRAFDLLEYGKMRYNLLGNADHWFPGFKADKVAEVERDELLAALSGSPFPEEVVEALEEADELLAGEQVRRLQEE
jgi:predicted aldo/keto reductase-like oxidoreductase